MPLMPARAIFLPHDDRPMPTLHLQSAQKKALDVLNSVGLGESMLRMIERRQRVDMYTAYGGMVSKGDPENGQQ
jgi:hypothetical protein